MTVKFLLDEFKVSIILFNSIQSGRF